MVVTIPAITRLLVTPGQTSPSKNHSFPQTPAAYTSRPFLVRRASSFVADLPSAFSLRCSSCTSGPGFASGFLQTPPRDDALALLLAFGSAKTWQSDFHRLSNAPCPAHTFTVCRAPLVARRPPPWGWLAASSTPALSRMRIAVEVQVGHHSQFA